MNKNIFEINNINFTKYDFDYLEKNIINYKNQSIAIITSREFKMDAELLYARLKKEYRVDIKFIPQNMCYSTAGINSLWFTLKENIRLIIALGDEHIHNACKLLSIKSATPYCFLSRDFPNLLSAKHNGLTFDGVEIPQNEKPQCLFKNYNLQNISLETCAYSFAQSFSLCLCPFENFISSKLSNQIINAKHNNYILSLLQNLLNHAKGCSLNNKKSILLASKTILRLSLLINEEMLNNEIFLIPQKYIFINNKDVKYFPLYNYFTFEILIKCLNQYFTNNLISPLSISLNDLLINDYNKNKINDILLNNFYNLEKLHYIFKTHKSLILSWLKKLDKLSFQFTTIIKSILTDSGFASFNKMNYKDYLSFIKINLINIENTDLSKINLISIF